MGNYLLAQDTVNGAEGSVFITLNGKNTQLVGMRNITTQAEIQEADMRVIGTRVTQTKHNGVKMTGRGNVYYGTPLFLEMLLKYINTGVMDPFNIQIINSDPLASVGQQNLVYYDCKLTGTVPMSILNDEEAMLNFDFNFSIGRVGKLQAFKAPSKLGN